MLRIVHLVGSAVSDFHAELSRLYAADCLTAVADPAEYDFHIAYVTPDGRWRFPADLGKAAIAAAPPLSAAAAVAHLVQLEPDAMVPQMFCLPGMTHYRALFDVLGIPYLGNPPGVMALAADKAKAKAVVAAAGVAVPAGQLLRRGESPTLATPAVVKPVDVDNSLGLGLARTAAAYPALVDAAFDHAETVLVETYVPLGREVRCGVLERAGALLCLPLEEYPVDEQRPIRTREDKLESNGSGELYLVAKDPTRSWIVDVDDPVTQGVWAAARECHRALGCRDYSLLDFRIDPAGRPWFLEAGLYCSFARTSVVTVMAAAAGIPLAQLFAATLQSALRRRVPGVPVSQIGP